MRRSSAEDEAAAVLDAAPPTSNNHRDRSRCSIFLWSTLLCRPACFGVCVYSRRYPGGSTVGSGCDTVNDFLAERRLGRSPSHHRPWGKTDLAEGRSLRVQVGTAHLSQGCLLSKVVEHSAGKFRSTLSCDVGHPAVAMLLCQTGWFGCSIFAFMVEPC